MSGAFAADQARSAGQGADVGGTQFALLRAQGDLHVFDVHTDGSVADVEPGVGGDEFHFHRVAHIFEGGQLRTAACVQAGQYVHDFQPVLFGQLALHGQGAIDVLAALHGEVDFAFVQDVEQGFHDHFAHFLIGIFTDTAADHFAGG